MQSMNLLPGVAIQPNLELKTRPNPVLGSLPLAFALPDSSERKKLALIQEDLLDNSLTSTQVNTIGEGFQLEMKKGEIINIKLKVCSPPCLPNKLAKVREAR
jgi:hypothetical protein